MSRPASVVWGVVEELSEDLGDVLWVVLDGLGLGPLLVRLREEWRFSNARSRRRSVVRILGSALPLKPVERPYLRFVALRSLSASCESLYSAHTRSGIDPRWLAESQQRSARFKPILSRCETTPNLFGLNHEDGEDLEGDSSPRSSTPFSCASEFGFARSDIGFPRSQYPSAAATSMHHQNSFQHSTIHAASPFTEPSALAKISVLEEELSKLRLQISSILNQPQRPLTPPSSPVPGDVTPVYRVPAPPPPPPPPPPPLSQGPPPPPPPPPPLSQGPPPLPGNNNASQPNDSTPRKLSFAEQIAQNKSSINQHSGAIDVPTNQNTSSSGPLCMADVLKGLNKVKLKRIDRSPGGTPIRDRAKSPVGGDPAAIIAAALKKRFAKMNAQTPEKEEEEKNDFDSSPETTPKTVRKSRKDFILPIRKSLQEETAVRNIFPTFKKPTPKSPRPPPKEEEKATTLPLFGQHLLKKRSPRPPESRNSKSPSSEASDLSR